MLDLRPASASLHRHHARFLDSALPEGLREADFLAFDRSRYPAETLDIGAQAWALRALDEYRSLAAFTELLALLSQLGLATDILGVGARVVRDEDRHVALSARMITALGGELLLEGDPAFVHAPTGTKRLAALWIIVGSLCVGETFSMRVLAAMLEHTQDPLAKHLIEVFAADESLHSRFGWSCFEVLAPSLDREEHDACQGWIAQALQASREAMKPTGDKHKGPRHPFGSIDDEVRVAVFERTHRDIVRDFRLLGFQEFA